MLAKSRKSAFAMTVVFSTSGCITAWIIHHLTGIVGSEAGTNVSSGGSNNVISPAIIILMLIFTIGFGLVLFSLWVYRRDDSHFGVSGAIRWAVMGVVCALLLYPKSILVPSARSADFAWQAGIYGPIESLWGILAFALSYQLAFKWLPFTRKQRAEETDEPPEENQAAQAGTEGSPLAKINELLAKTYRNPEFRLEWRVRSWYFIGGGILMLIIGLTILKVPNPYLPPSLIVVGVDCIIVGIELLLSLRRERIASWLSILSSILFVVFLYLLIRGLTYS